MDDNFFKAKFCERCGSPLTNGRTMSMYDTKVICMKCKDEETKRDDYKDAVSTDLNEIKKGNFNYKGIEG